MKLPSISWQFLVGSISALIFLITVGLWISDSSFTFPSLMGSNSSAETTIWIDAPLDVGVNTRFQAKVMIDTKDQLVNAAGIYLRYDPRELTLLSMDTTASFCQFYPEKKFDDTLGLISLACGSPHPGFKGTSTMMVLDFMAISPGESVILLTNTSQLLSSDGKATNLISQYPSHSIRIGSNL